MKIKGSTVLAIIVVIALVVVAAGSMYSLKEDEYAVVTRFNKIISSTSEPGLYFKAPFIDTVRRIPSKIQVYDINPSDVITSDKKSMIADDYILWQVTDPIAFTKTLNASITGGRDRVGVSVYNATKNIISSMSQDEVIEARGTTLTKTITTEAAPDVAGYGITILRAEIKALELPDDNKQAVYDRMISERKNIAASYRATGESDAQKIRNDTNRQVSIKKANAMKDAEKIKAEGEAGYMKTLSEAYNTEEKAEFYNFIRGIDALKNSLAGNRNNTVILDKDSELVRILYGIN
ncbi:MAG: protease modulator HflC [Lachnospiraceae bacterium]|nr:protease modulator HflC [Lachnospiraceae bacterium]